MMSVQTGNGFAQPFRRETEEARQGSLVLAMRIFAEFAGNDDDPTPLDAADAIETMAPHVACVSSLVPRRRTARR